MNDKTLTPRERVEAVTWLRKFITCSVFGPPPEEITKAQNVVTQLVAELEGANRRTESAERQLATTQPNNPCTCVPDGDDGSVAHLCEWHKHQFGKAYRMQNVADTLTVENILKLPQDALRLWIAHGIQESSARKKAEEQLARYRAKYGELE